jgi:hypothetical protein
MVVRHEFFHHVAQVPFAEEDKMVQALVPDCFDKPLRMRICSSGSAPGSSRTTVPRQAVILRSRTGVLG